MNPKRKQRLMAVGLIVFGVFSAIGLAAYALRSNIDLFFNPSQIASGEAPLAKRIRIGGMVVENSVRRDPDSLEVQFAVTDYQNTVTVTYTGILPDLFKEGQGIVTSGELNGAGVFEATEVLAKHDENYMPPNVQRALDSAHKSGSMPVQEGSL